MMRRAHPPRGATRDREEIAVMGNFPPGSPSPHGGPQALRAGGSTVDARSSPTMRRSAPALSPLSPAFAGAAATLSSIGLARFAYVPLFPAMVAAGWVSGAEGGFLGAANLAGYLIGVLGGRPLAGRLWKARAVDACMGLPGPALPAGALEGGGTWASILRPAAGGSGGGVMGRTRA